MKKIIICLLMCIMIFSGCIKKDYSDTRKEYEGDFLLKGGDDFIYISGKDLLDLKSVGKRVNISDDIQIEILLKRGSPNGTDVHIFHDKFICNLMEYDEIDESVTDEFGMPLENYNYEVSAYDINNDKKKEIIFLISNQEKIFVYVFSVDKNNKQIDINFMFEESREGQNYIQVNDLKNETTKKATKNMSKD